MKFNHLNVPTHWRNYWTRYPEGHTILEALISWVSQVDSMVDNQNKLNDNVEQFRNEIDDFIGRFDDRLQDEVTKTLSEWQNSGFLDVVISEALQWELDNYIATNEQDKLSLAAQLQQTEQELNEQLAQIAINIKSFGAVGDGVTDDTEAIRNATMLGKPLLIPDGTFKISGPIPITNSVYFHGKLVMEGSTGDETHRALVIKGTGDKNINIYNPQIDLGWDGVTTTGEQDHCIAIFGAENVVITGGLLENAMGDHVYIGGDSELNNKPAKNITVRNVTMKNSRRTNVALTGVDGVLIEQCDMVIHSDYVGSIDLEPNGNYHCLNVTIRENKITNTVGRGILLHPHYAERDVDNIKIINNEISAKHRCINAAYEKLGRILIDGNTLRDGEELLRINPTVEELIVTNNLFVDNKETVMASVGTSRGNPTNVTFRGNKFINTSGQRQRIDFTNIVYLTFESNITVGLSTSSADPIGAISLQNIENAVVSNNQFLETGAYAIGLAGTYQNVVINGNVFTPDLVNFPTYNKGGVIVSATAVINLVESTGNFYDPQLDVSWLIRLGATLPITSPEMAKMRTYYAETPDTTGSYNDGDRTINTRPRVGSPKAWVYTPTGWVSEGDL